MEGALYRRGFTVPGVRRLVTNQLHLCLASCIVAAAACWFARATLDFAMGAVIVTANFYGMAKFVHEAVYMKKGAVLSLLLLFYGRLLLTGIVLYVLIVWVKVSVAALVAGLSTALVTILIWGGRRVVGHKAKEA
ncbi:MAG: ATP synthase subunit I [Desulfovibrionaceae bacterium]